MKLKLLIRNQLRTWMHQGAHIIALMRVPFVSVVPNKIFVMTYQNAIACNPRYVVMNILKQRPEAEIVWCVDKHTLAKYEMLRKSPADDDPIRKSNRVRFVKRATVRQMLEQASSEVWLDNAHNCVWYWIPKKRGQRYIQFWHGSLGIKRIDSEAQGKHWLKVAARSGRATDLCCVNSRFEEEVFRESFWPNVRMEYTGHARNDILFDEKQKKTIKEKVCQHYNIPKDAGLLLYAPTFRTDKSTDFMNADFEKWKAALQERFGGTWKIIVRFHHKNKEQRLQKSLDVINGSDYPDMQELMIAADVGVSDYSSWMFDYILLRRPCFIYAEDISEYENDRGFYYPIRTTPFPIADNNDAMVKQIKCFQEEIYIQKLEEFLRDKGCMEDGHAAERIVDLIFSKENRK